MNKKLIIPITACFLLLCVVSAYGLVGHSANQILPGIFNGDFTIDGLLNVTGNIVAAEPTADEHVATRGYVLANGGAGPTWEGYTSSNYDGDMGGTKGMNAKCHSNYPGSHACTYDEIIKLGNDYPYSQNAWVIDGYATVGPNVCNGWSSSSSSHKGSYIRTHGYMELYGCHGYNYIPCCS